MAIRVKCRNDSCGRVFELPDDGIWQRVECPECGKGHRARPIEFSCSNAGCGRFLPYNKETAGKRVKCPNCGTVTRAPAPLATAAQRPAGGPPPAERKEKTKPSRLSRRRSRIARARRPGRPFLVTALALCVIVGAFAELVLVSDHFYPWHELAEPLATAGRFSKALLRESCPLADRYAFIAIGAADLLTILFLIGFFVRSNLMRWLAFISCLGGAVLSGVCSELILAAGWGALRGVAVVFLLLPATGRWVGWRAHEPAPAPEEQEG